MVGVNGGQGLRVAIIGAGPAGLTAGYELQKRDPSVVPVLFEGGTIVGGIARTESYKGFRFDIGGHRFFTKVGEVEEMWHEVMGDDFIIVPAEPDLLSRPLLSLSAQDVQRAVEYRRLRGRADHAELFQVASPPLEGGRELRTVGHQPLRRPALHALLPQLHRKGVGHSPQRNPADWAAQRIKNLSLMKAVINAITGANDTTSLIEEFHYPRLGPGMMWEKVTDLIRERGGAGPHGKPGEARGPMPGASPRSKWSRKRPTAR
jgi:hypothetical protein